MNAIQVYLDGQVKLGKIAREKADIAVQKIVANAKDKADAKLEVADSKTKEKSKMLKTDLIALVEKLQAIIEKLTA